jgi:hypothetical protein
MTLSDEGEEQTMILICRLIAMAMNYVYNIADDIVEVHT